MGATGPLLFLQSWNPNGGSSLGCFPENPLQLLSPLAFQLRLQAAEVLCPARDEGSASPENATDVQGHQKSLVPSEIPQQSCPRGSSPLYRGSQCQESQDSTAGDKEARRVAAEARASPGSAPLAACAWGGRRTDPSETKPKAESRGEPTLENFSHPVWSHTEPFAKSLNIKYFTSHVDRVPFLPFLPSAPNPRSDCSVRRESAQRMKIRSLDVLRTEVSVFYCWNRKHCQILLENSIVRRANTTFAQRGKWQRAPLPRALQRNWR